MPRISLPKIVIYYDSRTTDYWIPDAHGQFIRVTEKAVGRLLAQQGLKRHRPKTGRPSQLEGELIRIQTEQNIANVIALPGYTVGVHEICGTRVLVPSMPKLIVPQEGEFPLLGAIIQAMFVTPEIDQRPYVFGWLKIAIEALAANHPRPGQVLIMAGPRNSGKSLFQNLITELLGRKPARPYRYMIGRSEFNSELCEASHLIIEDDFASTLERDRRQFGARLKEFTVNEVQTYHAKGRPAMSVRRFARISVSMNDEPENLVIVPPLDDSIVDKLILLRVLPAQMPPTYTVEQRETFWAALMRELAAFAWFLKEWQIPTELVCGRFGVTGFQHPDLVEAIQGCSPENQLLGIIDAVVFKTSDKSRLLPTGAWQGTAGDLHELLVESDRGYEAKQLLRWPGAVGTYLGRLEVKTNRVRAARTAKQRLWIITPPREA